MEILLKTCCLFRMELYSNLVQVTGIGNKSETTELVFCHTTGADHGSSTSITQGLRTGNKLKIS